MQLDYYLPTHVILGEDALPQNAHRLKELGQSVLLVIDAAMQETHPAKVETLYALEYQGIKRTIYSPIRKTAASIDAIEQGAALAREAQAQFVLAVGCDATLEVGKAIAVLAVQDIQDATLLNENVQALPVVCIPTEPGSGTEVTPEIHANQQGLDRLTLVRNPQATPILALIDPRYSAWVDPRIIQNNYLKTMGRAIEALISDHANPMSDAIAIAALGSVADLTKTILNATRVDENGQKQGFTQDDRARLALASNQTGLAIALSGGANMLEALASPLTHVSKRHLGEAYALVIPPLVDYLIQRTPLMSDVVLQSLYQTRLEDLEDLLWEIIGEVEPITASDLDRAANAAANNPLIKQGILTLEYKDIQAAYLHLLADDNIPDDELEEDELEEE